MESGIDSSREVSCISVAEVQFMRPDTGGIPYFRSDMGDGTGTGFTEPENWSEHVPDGRVLAEGRALTGKEARISRPFSPRYRLLERVFRNLCGLPVSHTNIDTNTREKFVWEYPDDEAPAIETETFYWGTLDSAYRLTGGKIINMNIDVRRNADGGQVSGTIEYHFQRVARNVPVPSTSAQNEIKRITATSASGNGSFVLPATSLGVGGTLTVVPGDTAAELEAKIQAIAGYDDAGVVVAGATNDLSAGTAEVQRIVLSNVAAGAVEIVLNGVSVFFAAEGDNTAVDAALESHPDVGAGKVGVTGTLTENYDGTFSGTYTCTFSVTLGNVGQMTSPTTGVTTNTQTPGVAATLSNGYYLVTMGGALANENIDDWPASGGNGWTSTTQQQGAESGGVVYVEGPYLEPDTVRLYLATSDAELDDIDMDALPDEYGDDENADDRGMWKAVSSSISFADLWKAVYSLNKKRYATDFGPGARSVTANIEGPNDMSPGSDAEYLVDTANSCAATGFWIRRAWECEGYELWEDVFVSRTEAPAHGSDNDVWLKGFGLGRTRNPDGASYRATLILPL